MNMAAAVRGSSVDLRALIAALLADAPDGIVSEEKLDAHHWDGALLQPALDMLRRPGKGIRAELFESCWNLVGGTPRTYPAELPLLVELLHVGSLIIDDIEDDSPVRRGEVTLHRRVGVPVALNTGNWMCSLPLALLARLELPESLKLSLYVEISDALVLCHKGQALDLSARVTHVRQGEMPGLVEQTTRLKTGSLMRLAAMLAGRAAGAEPEVLAALGRFGALLGLGLQMLDDWSGIAVEARRQKGIEDIKLGRPTWPWAWLAASCDEVTYAALLHEARSMRIEWEVERLLLRLRTRLHHLAPTRIHAHLQRAFHELRDALGPSPAMDELRHKVDALESAYD